MNPPDMFGRKDALLQDHHQRCQKPQCKNSVEVATLKWCKHCWYPGIDEDQAIYRAYLADGEPQHKAMLMVGWADPAD